MKLFEIRIVLTILVFILMIISGIALSRKGTPYNVILFNIHKLISLGAIAMMLITVLHYSRDYIIGKEEIIVFVSTAVLFLLLLISGGLLNIKKEMPKFIRTLHRLLPILLVTFSILSIVLLSR